VIQALKDFIAAVGTVESLGIVLVLFAAVFLFSAHRSTTSPINFANTLTDSDGRTSLRKLGEWVALLTSTWVLVFLTKSGLLTETYFGCYLLIWVARAAIGPILGAKAEMMSAAAKADPQ
jgi:hypothetical protein